MMRHFYAPLLQGQAQQVLEGFGEQRFWLGRQYGVAIRRQAGTGIIAITAGLGLLVVGGVGLQAVFRAQARHQQRMRALERRLALQERLASLGDLAAGVAHEVRNPPNAIGMGIQRLAGEFSPVEGQQEYRSLCQIIRGEVARLNTICRIF
jgi:signal transduction histidine kinase